MTIRLRRGPNGDGQPIGLFRCPGCQDFHQVRIMPGWHEWNGDEERPTLQGSVLVEGPMRNLDPVISPGRCHSFVTDGRIRFLDDCTHPLAGQMVELPHWYQP